jgi:hypothetical protein
MPATMRSSLPIAMAACLTLSGLAACGPVADAMDEARGGPLTSKFGVATRERLESDPEGRTFRVMIDAKQAATWPEASTAIAISVDRCDDGESTTALESTPELATPADVAIEHPAGTTFTQTYRCAGPLPGEFEVAAGTETTEAVRLVEERLQAGAEIGAEERIETADGTLIRFAASPSSFGRRKKYGAIDDLIGSRMNAAFDACRGPATLRQVVVATWPRKPASARHRPFEDMVVGTEVECAVPAAVAAGTTP